MGGWGERWLDGDRQRGRCRGRQREQMVGTSLDCIRVERETESDAKLLNRHSGQTQTFQTVFFSEMHPKYKHCRYQLYKNSAFF